MEVIIGIILLVSFVGMVIYAVKGGNMALGVIIMAICGPYWRSPVTTFPARILWRRIQPSVN